MSIRKIEKWFGLIEMLLSLIIPIISFILAKIELLYGVLGIIFLWVCLYVVMRIKHRFIMKAINETGKLVKVTTSNN